MAGRERARRTRGFGGAKALAAFALALSVAVVRAPEPRAAGEGGAQTEDFGGALGGWSLAGDAPASWAKFQDEASPSAEKTVFGGDGPAGPRGAFLTAAETPGAFGASARMLGEAGGWVGLGFRYRPSDGSYLAARFEVGGSNVAVVRMPSGEPVAGPAPAPPPNRISCITGGGGVPSGDYFKGAVEMDAAGALRVFRDDALVLETTLPEEDRAGGYAGIVYEGGSARFDLFELTDSNASGGGPALLASAVVDPDSPGAEVPEELFGAFAQWYATPNGMPTTSVSLDHYRDALADLQAVFPLVADAGVRTIRFPGGLLANEYHWKRHIGDYHARNDEGGLGVDEFMTMAESLGARVMFTVNASDPGTPDNPADFDPVGDAADLVEYLTAPADGSNPDPDGLAPDDPANVDWARMRADNGHREPYPMLGFEIGNELRGPPHINASGAPGDRAYAAKYADRLIAMSTAMKAVNPEVVVGAVGHDNPFADKCVTFLGTEICTTPFADWYEEIFDRTEAADCDSAPGDGVVARCLDFWVKHVFTPVATKVNNAVGFFFDRDGLALDGTFEVASEGSINLLLAAYATDGTGGCPQVLLEVDGGAALSETVEVCNSNAPETSGAWPDMGLYRTAAATLAPGTHAIRATRVGAGTGGARRLVLYPLLALEEGADVVGRVDLRDARTLAELLQYTAESYRPFVLRPTPPAEGEAPSGTIHGLPVWVTEISSTYEEMNDYTPRADHWKAPFDPASWSLREALIHANMYLMFLERGVRNVTAIQLFDETRGTGLIEGVAGDPRHGDELGADRVGTDNPPRMRPRGLLMREMARHWRGARLPMAVDSPTYSVNAQGFSFGFTGALGGTPEVPYVTGLSTLEAGGRALTVTLVNTSLQDAVFAEVDLGGFAHAGAAERAVISGEGPWANNEPESDVCSKPGATPETPCAPGVETARDVIATPDAALSVVLPPSSMTFLRVPALGADLAPPEAPEALEAAGEPGGLGLSWRGPADAVAYNVYRALHFEPSDEATGESSDALPTPCAGAWGARLNGAPVEAEAFLDPGVDGGAVYCYSVRALDAAGNEGEAATLRVRATEQVRLRPELLDYDPAANTILYGTTLASAEEDYADDAPPPGEPAEYLILKPRVQADPTRPPLFPQLDRNLDFSIRSEVFAGDPDRLVALRLVYASRFKGPFYQGVPRARLYLKNYALGGAWEEVVAFEEPTPFQKTVRIVRRAGALDYLSPAGRVELRVTTLDGGLYNEFFLEHVRVELETL